MNIYRRSYSELIFAGLLIAMACTSIPSHADDTAPAYADDKDEAVNTSADFVKALTDGDLASTYRQTSTRFQVAVPEEGFIQNIGMMRIQLGGPLTRWTLQGAQELSRLPATGEAGHFYFVRLAASYSTVNLLYDIGLDKQDGRWKVLWFNWFPAPPQS